MKIFGLYLLIFAQFSGILSKPFLYNIGETLVNLLTTASSASSFSTPENSNIADYRTNKSSMSNNNKNNNVDDDDDFFKIPFDKEELSTEQPQSSQLPEFITRKIGKIIRKIQFIQQLSNFGNNNNNNSTVDDFDKEIEEFDKEFDEDFNKNKTTIDINKKYSNNDDDNIDDNNHKILFNPTGITVFFMEAIGSIIGLVYGAAAQFNQRETTTVNSV